MDLENGTAEDATILVYAELWSPGASQFKTGTFTYTSSSDIAGKHVFENIVVMVDTDNNKVLDENDAQVTVKAGTVKVTGSESNYTVEMDVTLSNNKPLKGKYSGSFDVYEGSLEEMGAQNRRAGKANMKKLK